MRAKVASRGWAAGGAARSGLMRSELRGDRWRSDGSKMNHPPPFISVPGVSEDGIFGLKKEHVLDAVRVIVAQHDRTRRVMRRVEDYEGGCVSKQILRIVMSYTDYVNRTVWSK